MCCTQLAIQDAKNDAKNRHLRTIAQFSRAISSQLRHESTIWKKLVKQQYVLHMSPQYGELRLITAEICWRLWGTPANFNGFGVFLFTAAMSLTGGQPNFARCLAVSWAATLYTHFRGLLSPDSISPGAILTLRPILHSRILAALLHGTPAVAVSQTLRRGTRNGIAELSQRAPPIFGIFGRAAITLGIGSHSSHLSCIFFFSSPNLSGRRLDVYHTSTNGVALVRI